MIAAQGTVAVVWKAGAGIASVAGGVLVAAALGSAPSWSMYLLVALCLATGAVVLGSAAQERARERRTRTPSSEPKVDRNAAAQDTQLVQEVCRLIQRRDIVWLMHHDFMTPWRAIQIEPWIELLELGARGYVPFDAELERAYNHLIQATSSFIEAHEQNTFPDELIAGEWRDIGWSTHEDVTTVEPGAALFEERRARLNESAAEAVTAYASFLDTAQRMVDA